MKYRLIFVYLSIALYGCAASPQIQEQASKDLVGNCLQLFLNSGVGGYQYVANAATGRAAFALASDTGGQSCGMATNMSYDVSDSLFLSLPNVDRVEALAIQRCEQAKQPNIKSPCRTYARNNTIVWRNALSKGME
jgi:hypothetical protein